MTQFVALTQSALNELPTTVAKTVVETPQILTLHEISVPS